LGKDVDGTQTRRSPPRLGCDLGTELAGMCGIELASWSKRKLAGNSKKRAGNNKGKVISDRRRRGGEHNA
jgi:hypothetical protein